MILLTGQPLVDTDIIPVLLDLSTEDDIQDIIDRVPPKRGFLKKLSGYANNRINRAPCFPTVILRNC